MLYIEYILPNSLVSACPVISISAPDSECKTTGQLCDHTITRHVMCPWLLFSSPSRFIRLARSGQSMAHEYTLYIDHFIGDGSGRYIHIYIVTVLAESRICPRMMRHKNTCVQHITCRIYSSFILAIESSPASLMVSLAGTDRAACCSP